MFRRKSLDQHERELQHRFGGERNNVSSARLKYRCLHAVEALRIGKPNSPEVWAMHARTLSVATRFIMHSYNPEVTGGYLEISAHTAIRCMAACVKKCTDRCADYRQQGIDPQIEVVIKPCLEHAKATYAEWKANGPVTRDRR